MTRSSIQWSAILIAAVALCLAQTATSTAATPQISLKLSQTHHARLVSRAFVSFKTMHDVQTRTRALVAKAKFASRSMPVRTGLSPEAFRRAQMAALRNSRAPIGHGAIRAPFLKANPNFTNIQTGAASFEGMADSGFICSFLGVGCAPPDMGLAAGPGHILQAVNTSVSSYEPSVQSEELGWPLDFNSFLGGGPAALLNGCDPFGPFMSDPRAFYDAATGRYWVSMIQIDGVDFLGDSCNDMSVDWFAVSVDSNPNDGFYAYAFDVSNGGVDLTDYPRLGYDDGADLVEASYNDFGFTGGYDGNGLLYLDKAGMEAGTGPANAAIFLGVICNSARCEGDTSLDSVAPVDTIASGAQDPKMLINVATLNFGTNNGNGCGNPQPCSHVATFAVLNPFSNNPVATGVIPPTPEYVLPPAADVATFGGPCQQCVETLDNRISATAVYSAAHHSITWAIETGINNGTQVVPGILWVEEAVSTNVAQARILASVRQSGYVFGSGDLALSFGATAKDGGGIILLADYMGGTVYPGALYLEHANTDPPGTFSELSLLRAGTGVDIFDGRWGDYEATSWDGQHAWVASQFINGSGDWDTQIARSDR